MATIPLPVSKSIITTQQWGIPITNEVNGHTTSIAALNAQVQRELGYAEQTTIQNNISTGLVDLTGLAITFTLTAARRVLLYASVYFNKAAPDTTAVSYVLLRTSAGATVNTRGFYIPAPGAVGGEVSRRLILAAGTYTYKVTATTSAGFLNTASSPTEPSLVGAIDLGPQ